MLVEVERGLGRPVAVFDLDSTLFDVSPRTQNILREFLALPQIRKDFAAEVEFLRNLVILPQDWGLRQGVERSGLKSTEIFYRALREYWRKNFFSSDFMHFDRPYDGAIEYVQALAAKNIEIFYLTGRDEENMKAGTLRVLAHWGFPLLSAHTHLMMKPIKGSVDDAEFKEIELRKLVQKHLAATATSTEAPSIWFFENEPIIIRRIVDAGLPIKVVWIDTTHSGRAAPPTGLPIIQIDGWQF